MRVSGNEVQNLAAKAARGAGAPPAQASDFGRATLCHLRERRDPQALFAALDALPDGPILTFPLLFMRLQEAAKDQTSQGALDDQNYPDLLLSYAQSQLFETQVEQRQNSLIVTMNLECPNKFPAMPRVELPDGLAALLQSLAAKTFVPETEQSRRSGAGAGLTDND